MMTIGNNIGYIEGDIPNTPSRTNNSTIYRLTHKTNGSRYSFIARSYISFSFGGKNIEDFELIVTEQGATLKNLTASFQDLTNNYEIVDGQFYWGTYFSDRQISLTLTTDSMTQENLDAFTNWFKPGETRELIMAEHPNRAIMARLSEQPTIEVVPFEAETSVMIGGTSYITTTVIYKGTITLNFIADSPFWYAKTNLLLPSTTEENEAVLGWRGENDVYVLNFTKDVIRVILEDRIVPRSAMQASPTFGDRFIYNGNNNVMLIEDYFLQTENKENLKALFNFHSGVNLSTYNESQGVINNYVFYGGTAPVKPIIQLTVPILLEDSLLPGIIMAPANSATKKIGLSINNYSTITLEGEEVQELKITIPNVYISYNQALLCIDEATSYANLRELFDNRVTQYYAHNWAIYIINYMEDNRVAWDESARERVRILMTYFVYGVGDSRYIIDGSTNHAYAILGYRKIEGWVDLGNGLIIRPMSDEEWKSYGEVNTDIEDVSDIMLSDYLEIKERNHLNSEGMVQEWSFNDKTATHQLYHDFGVQLTDVAVLFKNMYY